MKSNKKATAFVIISAMLWGTYGSFVTVISTYGIHNNTMMFLRFLFTSLPVFLYLLGKDRRQLSVKREDLILFLANGLASILFFTSCYTAAIKETKIATAAALLYTSPAMVMILSGFLFREKITSRKVISILISVVGCALVSGIGAGEHAITGKGLLLGLGAALGYSLYSIFSRMLQNRGYSTLTNVLYTFGIAAAGYCVLSVKGGTFSEVVTLPAASFLSVLCGLTTGLVAYLLYTAGLQDMEPSKAAQLATVEPVFAALLGVLLFGQRLSFLEVLGIIFVVFAVLYANRDFRPKEKR